MLPVERAKLLLLNAFAVLAFSAEISRLPVHCAARFGPVKTTAQTMPSRFTTVPHIWLPSPPFASWPSLTAAVRAAFNFAWSGSLEQSWGLGLSLDFCADAS